MPLPSRAKREFWQCYRSLPNDIKRQAKQAYRVWLSDPFSAGIRFKKLKGLEDIYSIRIGNYRALAYLQDGVYYWYFIGTHAEYDKRIH